MRLVSLICNMWRRGDTVGAILCENRRRGRGKCGRSLASTMSLCLSVTRRGACVKGGGQWKGRGSKIGEVNLRVRHRNRGCFHWRFIPVPIMGAIKAKLKRANKIPSHVHTHFTFLRGSHRNYFVCETNFVAAELTEKGQIKFPLTLYQTAGFIWLFLITAQSMRGKI